MRGGQGVPVLEILRFLASEAVSTLWEAALRPEALEAALLGVEVAIRGMGALGHLSTQAANMLAVAAPLQPPPPPLCGIRSSRMSCVHIIVAPPE
jgi:hypothetical protein